MDHSALCQVCTPIRREPGEPDWGWNGARRCWSCPSGFDRLGGTVEQCGVERGGPRRQFIIRRSRTQLLSIAVCAARSHVSGACPSHLTIDNQCDMLRALCRYITRHISFRQHL